MDPSYTQHASAVAREVVRIGLADQDSVRRLYQDYTQYLQQGVRASFTQLLLSRGLIDQQGFDRIQGVVPGPDGGALSSSLSSGGSGVASLVKRPTTTPPSDRMTLPGPPEDPPGSSSTSVFNNVLSPSVPTAPGNPLLDDSPLEISSEGQGLAQTPGGSYGGLPTTPGTTFDVLDPVPGPGGRIASTTGSNAMQPPNGGGLDLVPEVAPDRDPHAGFIMSDSAVVPEEQKQEPEEEKEPQPGDRIGKYTLIKAIGRGGMGVIYTAKKDSGETLALKVLMGGNDLGSDRRRQRFRREVEAMRRLEHGNIVKVYDYGRKGPFDWYSMDFIEGADFEKLLEEDDLEQAEKMQVFFDICSAMAHAHERSVIHRDLKPQNVIVDKSGRGHVLDFGLAKIVDQEIGMTRTGSALGTPFYMSPEQLRSAKHIDARADVFSLGVILYEISTGVRPFDGETAAEVGTNILNTEPPRPTTVKPNLHPDIDAMCVKALEKDPNRRYADANALLEDLIRHRKGFGVEGVAGVSGAMGDMRRWAERNRMALLGAAVPSLAIVVLLIGFALSAGDDPPPFKKPPRPPVADGDDDDFPPDDLPPDDLPPDDLPPDTVPANGTTDGTSDGSDTSDPPPKDPGGTKPPPKDPGNDPPPKDPGVKPVVEPIDKPVEARTEEEKVRLALAPPEESGPVGAEEAKNKNSASDARQSLIFALEEGVIPAMGSGDLKRAAAAVGALRRNSSIQGVSPLVREVEHDIETLTKLRKLVGIRLKEKKRRLSRVAFWQGDTFPWKSMEILDGGFLELSGRGASAVVDPLALKIESLKPVVIHRHQGGKKPSVGNESAYYGLAVLGLYRDAREEKELLDKAGGKPAVRRRRRTWEWLSRARKDVWRDYQKGAENAWRELDKKKKGGEGAYLRALDDFVAEFGRSQAYLDRRSEWIKEWVRLTELRDVVEGASRKNSRKLTYKFKRDQIRDFVVRPFKREGERVVFRAAAESSSLVMENGRIVFPLGDLYSNTGMLEVSTRGEDLISVWLMDMRQEIDPDASWVVKFKNKTLKEDTNSRKMSKAVEVIFEEKKEKELRFFRVSKKYSMELPANKFGRKPNFKTSARGNTSYGSLGAEAQGHLRVTAMELEWAAAENPGKMLGLRKRLVGKRLLRKECEENAKPGRGASVLLSMRPDSLAGFSLLGEWTPGRGEIKAGQGAGLWVTQGAKFGQLEFEFACDDGPGVMLHMSASFKVTRKTGETSWQLPSTLKPDPNAWRKVVCRFNLKSKIVAVEVDGVPLVIHRDRLPTRSAYFAIEFMGRTTGQVRNLRLLQFQPQ